MNQQSAYAFANRRFSRPVLVGTALLALQAAAGPREVNRREWRQPWSPPGKGEQMRKVLDPHSCHVTIEGPGGPWMSKFLAQMDEEAERQARWRRGAVSERLHRKLQEARRRPWHYAARGRAPDAGKELLVAVTLKHPEVRYYDKTRHTLEELENQSRNLLHLRPLVRWRAFAERHGLRRWEKRGNGTALCKIKPEELARLQFDPDVASIDEVEEDAGMQSGTAPISYFAWSAYNPGPVPPGAGSGVRAATFERGLTGSFLGCSRIAPALWDSWDGDPAALRHTQAAFLSLAYAAPGATLYHRRSLTFHESADVQYIIDNRLQTVSISRTRGGTDPYPPTYQEFRVMDDFAYRFPYPVFVTGTANAGYEYEVNWQGYNAVSVGNVRHTGLSYWEMAGCTQARNPDKIYGGCLSGQAPDCPGDREMPYIVAPGIGHNSGEPVDACLEGYGPIGCGTSYSAPVVNGIAAAVIGADSRMAYWPEKVRAALVVTARNVDGGHWHYRTDGRDGAGVVSGNDAMAFARSHSAVSVNNAPVEHGLYAGSMYGSDFSSNKRFYLRVPNPKPAGRHLRVVLTWDSNPVLNAEVNSLSDLDLSVRHEGGISGSYSWDGNVEVVDVDPANLAPGGAYEIVVSPVVNRIPSGARTNFFYWSLAWTWVRDHAN